MSYFINFILVFCITLALVGFIIEIRSLQNALKLEKKIKSFLSEQKQQGSDFEVAFAELLKTLPTEQVRQISSALDNSYINGESQYKAKWRRFYQHI